jgi:predicted pyridoxine 5'-phosphate oxidase superfamily flavin-nucleotide-binding protein
MAAREPFHAGEIAVQTRAGERAQALKNGAMLHDFVTPGAGRFLSRQRLIAVALADGAGQPWASLWLGESGFVECLDERTLWIRTSPPPWAPFDPTNALVSKGRMCGLLAIDLGSRQRLRINGEIGDVGKSGFLLEVRESFANCPKYIQRRELGMRTSVEAATTAPARSGSALGSEQCERIERADTLFVASRHPERGLDVSHRGGTPGFVRVLGPRTLRFPDYPGNGMFQTLGNFEVDPRAGVVTVDFERSVLLSLTGAAKVIWEKDDAAHPSGGTGRYWQLELTEWVEFSLDTSLAARLVERSPFNPPSFECLID